MFEGQIARPNDEILLGLNHILFYSSHTAYKIAMIAWFFWHLTILKILL